MKPKEIEIIPNKWKHPGQHALHVCRGRGSPWQYLAQFLCQDSCLPSKMSDAESDTVEMPGWAGLADAALNASQEEAERISEADACRPDSLSDDSASSGAHSLVPSSPQTSDEFCLQ